MTAALQKKFSPTTVSAIDRWQALWEKEMIEVDRVIHAMTQSETEIISTLASHIISSGGKRLRPIIAILSSKLCGYSGDRHIKLSAALEFFHTATLLHDDVVDGSKLRRGVETAHQLWGNAPSVLVGDFLFSRSFQLIVQDGSLDVLGIFSETLAAITEGEVKQLEAVNDIATSEELYTQIIAAKTAVLFAAACQVGGVIAERSELEIKALQEFGLNLGIAFQIADDALDYSAKQEELGKAIGDDFREGKVTLPVIIAYANGNDEEKRFWERVVEGEQDERDFSLAISIMASHEVLAHAMEIAQSYANKAIQAINVFDDCDEKQAMLDLLAFSVNRPY